MLSEPMMNIEYSPDCKYLIVASYFNSTHVIDVETGTLNHIFEDNTSGVNIITFSLDRQKFATCSIDKSFIVWSL
eukprot:TRINITY_DN3030_c4_g11_i2.p3 TRINITY_DN3030_c4_g11~~TRINITY_DN3030_c4_g11_i2.p3  ORF type:complete len:75 (-),score=11.34 TRINITY_DN3030_c4_g11_i2:1214-1438(-)